MTEFLSCWNILLSFLLILKDGCSVNVLSSFSNDSVGDSWHVNINVLPHPVNGLLAVFFVVASSLVFSLLPSYFYLIQRLKSAAAFRLALHLKKMLAHLLSPEKSCLAAKWAKASVTFIQLATNCFSWAIIQTNLKKQKKRLAPHLDKWLFSSKLVFLS